MQDNFTNDVMEQLIRYIDGESSPQETAATEKLLSEDAAVKERYDNLLAARDAIRSKGIQQRVQALHHQFYNEINTRQTAKIIKPAFGNFKLIARIAAVFILVIAGYAVYEYSATTSETLYADNFINYQLPVTRGDHQQADVIDSLYQANNYAAVIASVQLKPQKVQKDYFLAGLAWLETGNAAAAINAFKNVEQLNNNSPKKYFVQETDYYLALAYIKAGNIEEAEKQLNVITTNKQHMYYQKASEISRTKLTMLKWKE